VGREITGRKALPAPVGRRCPRPGGPYSKNGKAGDERARPRWQNHRGGYGGPDRRLLDGKRKPLEMIGKLSRDVRDYDSPESA
jgi:hypothetical protein